MANGQLGTVLRYLRHLVGTGEVGDRTDGQLLESFAGRHETAAFEALVHRHAPLVWSVCRRILRDEHEAEDVFQATFLVLVKKAPTLDRRGSLGNWLYTVAYHLALKARMKAARQRTREKEAADMVQTILPPTIPRNCVPFSTRNCIACRPSTAARWCSAISRARRTRKRPANWAARPAPCPATWTAPATCSANGWSGAALPWRLPCWSRPWRIVRVAAVPPGLLQATIQAGLLYAGGQTVADVLSVKAVALAEGWLQAAFAAQMKIAAVVLLTIGLLGTGAGVWAYRSKAPRTSRLRCPWLPSPNCLHPPRGWPSRWNRKSATGSRRPTNAASTRSAGPTTCGTLSNWRCSTTGPFFFSCMGRAWLWDAAAGVRLVCEPVRSSNPHVIDLLNHCFVPVYLNTNEYKKDGPVCDEERTELQRTTREIYQAKLQFGTQWAVILSPTANRCLACTAVLPPPPRT